MSGPLWTPEPDADRSEPRPLSPDPAQAFDPSQAQAQPTEPAVTRPHAQADHDATDPDEAPRPAPTRKRPAFKFPSLKFIKLPSLGSERHEMMPEVPRTDPGQPAEPPARKKPVAKFPLLGLKRETRVGIAALLSFVVLVAALVVKKGWVGKAVPLAINANTGEKSDPPAEKDKKPDEPKKEPKPPEPDPPLAKDEEPKPAPQAAPADRPTPDPKLAGDSGTNVPPSSAPTSPTKETEPPGLPPTPTPTPTAEARPLEPPGGDSPLLPGDSPATPETAPVATTPPAPPSTAGLPEAPPLPSTGPGAPTGTEATEAPPALGPMPVTQAEPPPAPEPPPLSKVETPPIPKVEPSPIPKVETPPIPKVEPSPMPKAEATAPVRAEKTPTLDPVPTPVPGPPAALAEPVAARASTTAAATASALGAGWVVIKSGGKRIPGAGAGPSAEPSTIADGPRSREDATAVDQVEPVLHRVMPGENFYTISQTYYRSGRYYKALHAANGRQVPKIDELYVGTVLRIPPPEALDRSLILPASGRLKVADEPTGSKVTRTSRRDDPAAEVELALPTRRRRARPDPEVADEPQRPTYKVKPHETLRSIARDTLGDSTRDREILGLNRDIIDDPTALSPGTVLTLPEDAVIGRRAR
jgi:nucleoid-associated protein YgaU